MVRLVSAPTHYAGTVACDGACGRRRLEEGEFFFHCSQCRFDLCPECAADPDARGGRSYCVYVCRPAVAANERALLLNACQNAIATGRDGRRMGWHDRGWTTGEAMHAEMLAGLEQRQRGLVAFNLTRDDADLIATRLRESRLPRHGAGAVMSVEVLEEEAPVLVTGAAAASSAAARAQAEARTEATLTAATAAVETPAGGERVYSVMVGRTGGVRFNTVEYATHRSALLSDLRLADPPSHPGSFGWLDRGFESEMHFEALNVSGMQEGVGVLLARRQTRREAHVLRARVEATSARLLSATVIGPDEAPEDPRAARAFELGQAAFEAFSTAAGVGGAGGGGGRGRAGTLRMGQIGFFDRALLPTKTLPISALVQAFLTSNENTLLPDVVAYVRLGEAVDTVGLGPAQTMQQTHLPNLVRGGWRVADAVESMRRGERALAPLLETVSASGEDPNSSRDSSGDSSRDSSRALVEHIWMLVCATEAAGRHYPPMARLEAKLAASQDELERLVQLLLAGPDAPGWTAMEEGWLRQCWQGDWRVAPAIARMRQGERRPSELLLREDPRSDGLSDVVLSEVLRREAEPWAPWRAGSAGAPGTTPASSASRPSEGTATEPMHELNDAAPAAAPAAATGASPRPAGAAPLAGTLGELAFVESGARSSTEPSAASAASASAAAPLPGATSGGGGWPAGLGGGAVLDAVPLVSVAVDPEEELVQALVCPLTLEMMEHPVLAMDGFTYERSAIEAFFRHTKHNGQLLTSPMSRRVLESERLLPNRALKAVIEARKRMRMNVRAPSRPFSRQNSQNASDRAVDGAHDGALDGLPGVVPGGGVLPSATSLIETELGIGGHHVSPARRVVSPSTRPLERAVSSALFPEVAVPIPQRVSSEPVGRGLVPLSPSRRRATSNNPPPPEEEELA
jgi:hypothetical protein